MYGSTIFNTSCVYGGLRNTLEDYGNLNSLLAFGLRNAAGAFYDFGDSSTTSIGYESE